MSLTAPPTLPADPPTTPNRQTQTKEVFSAAADDAWEWLFGDNWDFIEALRDWYADDAKPELEALQADVTTKAGTATTQAGIATAAAATATAAAASATGASDVNGTSTTTRTPTVGTQTWVYVETGKLPYAGMRMRAASRAALTTNYALGTVASHDAGTRTVTLTVDQVGAAPASASDWNLLLEGEPGQPGADAEVRSLVQTRSANGTITAADLGATLRCTATITLDPDSAASLGDGFSALVDAPGHAVTIDGVGTVPVAGLGLVQSDGTTITLRLLGASGNAPVAAVTATAAAAALLNTGLDGGADVYDLVVFGVTSVANAEIRLRYEVAGTVVTTSTYQANAGNNHANSGVTSGAPASYVAIGNCGNGASNSFNLTIRIYRPANTSVTKHITWTGSTVRTETQFLSGNAINQGTGALTGIQLTTDSGAITCTMRLYAVPNA